MNARVTSHDLQVPLRTVVKGWPQPLQRAFREYQSQSRGVSTGAFHAGHVRSDQPYWILLPRWLHTSYLKPIRPTAGDRAFLTEALLGQYCLFLAFRIRDDLMDDRSTPPILRLAADRLLQEAATIFSEHFPPGDPFWKLYHQSVSGTAGAISFVDTAQRSHATRLASLRKAYARVNSVFRVGTAAVCHRHSRPDDFPMLRSFSDNFSTACQILDDLEDIAEDLDRGRWNFAANYALRRARVRDTGDWLDLERVTGSLVRDGAGIALLGVAETHLMKAFSAIEPLHLPHAEHRRRAYRAAIDAMKLELFAAGIDSRRRHARAGLTAGIGSRV